MEISEFANVTLSHNAIYMTRCAKSCGSKRCINPLSGSKGSATVRTDNLANGKSRDIHHTIQAGIKTKDSNHGDTQTIKLG